MNPFAYTLRALANSSHELTRHYWQWLEFYSHAYMDAIDAEIYIAGERAWPTRTGTKLKIINGGKL